MPERTRQSPPDVSSGAAAPDFFGVSQDLLCVLGWEGGIHRTNPAWQRTMGEPEASPTGPLLLDLAHPDDRPVVAGLLDRLRTDFAPCLFESRFRCPDGSYLWLECQATALPAQRVLYVSARDITDRKVVEAELRKLSAFPRLNPHAVFEFSAAGQLTYFNDAATEMARAAGERHPSSILPSDAVAVVKHCLRTGESRPRLENQAAGRVFSWAFYPIPDSQVVHCYAVDITDKRQLETQFLRAQRLETVGRLATGIAHDLNNILAPIMMSVNLLQESLTQPHCGPLLETLRAAVQRGADMIKQILSFTRGQPGASAEVHLRLLLLEMARIVAETFPRSIRVQTTAPKELRPVQADPTQVHQILMNLCVNARDAMPSGGTLSLQAENLTLAAPDLPEGTKPGDYVLLTVSDTGTGIPPEVLARIWEPFFTLKPAGQGTGLGLSTVLSIVKGHEGFVRVDSRPGQGSQFQIFLPAAPVPPAPAGVAPVIELPVGQGRGELILVVDDEHAFQEIARAILQRHGYRVLTASDGSEGLECFMRHRNEVDLILTDMIMPLMGGAALIDAVREANSQVAVLAVSGLGEQERLSGALRNTPLLLKPFTTERLLRSVSELLNARQGLAA